MESIEKNILKLTEKKKLGKAANIAGAACAGMLVLSVVLQLILMLILQFCGMNMLQQQEFFKENTVLMLMQVVLSATMFTLPFVFAVKLGKERVLPLLSFEKIEKGTGLPYILMALGICEISEILATRFVIAVEALGFSPKYDLGFEYKTDPLSVCLIFLAVAVLPALVEEFAMRGIVLGLFRPFGDGFAIIASAAVFGFIHGNLVQIPFAFMVGLILGFITIKTGSMWPACIVHFINNGSSVLMEYVSNEVSTTALSLLRIGIGLLWLALGIIGAILISRKREDAFSIKKSESVLSTGEKAKAALLVPGTIIAIILVVIGMLAQ